jgi:hypothetical protein
MLTLKITISLLFTLKNHWKHEHFLKTIIIVEFFLIIWGKWSELEPEPEFSTSWSRSRTKMDQLRNTGCDYVDQESDFIFIHATSF